MSSFSFSDHKLSLIEDGKKLQVYSLTAQESVVTYNLELVDVKNRIRYQLLVSGN